MTPSTDYPAAMNQTHHASVALYIHVPFCRMRCAYCDFNTYAGMEAAIPTYVDALCREIIAAGERWGALPISTIYVGGGTPSLVPVSLLSDVVAVVDDAFDLSECIEFSLEANPGTVNATYLRDLRALGVTRLSLGVQSTHDAELNMLGRIHSWDDVLKTVDAGRAAGFSNLSLDLLFGLPGQSLKRWKASLHSVLALEPEHLSLYGLAVEEGTPLFRRIQRREISAIDDETAASMYERAETMLASAGFFHYEISNWARTEPPSCLDGAKWWPHQLGNGDRRVWSEEISDRVCRHNLTYWRNEPWLGVGAGAHSWITANFLGRSRHRSAASPVGWRWANVDHPNDYIAVAHEQGGLQGLGRDVEEIDQRLAKGETMMLGLRLAEGVSSSRFESRFGVSLTDAFGEELDNLRDLGLLAWDGKVARLTARGRLLGNRVFARFI